VLQFHRLRELLDGVLEFEVRSACFGPGFFEIIPKGHLSGFQWFLQLSTRALDVDLPLPLERLETPPNGPLEKGADGAHGARVA
jgi:hypothetical protein